jgi:OOP family OmpA-OmpF porin
MQGVVRTILVVALLATTLVVSGCATRHYVKQQVGTLEPQIADVRNVEAEQSGRIDATDLRAKAAIDLADKAIMAAAIVNEKAIAADRRAAEADRRADAAYVEAKRALNQIDGVESEIQNRIASLDKYSLTEQKIVAFKFNSDDLSKEALSRLDDLAGMISGATSGYLIEIQGFTDSVGSEKYNFSLSERRAASVLRYFVSRGIPLYRISVVGLGKTNPAADNRTVEGRGQNRRVEIRVLTSGSVASANR